MVTDEYGGSRGKILSYIRAYHEREGIGPSIRDICSGVGLKSPSNVHRHVHILIAEGRVSYDSRIPGRLIYVEV